jgi:trigger factor
MQVTETNVDGLKHSFKVVVTAGQIEGMLVSRLEQVSRDIKMPGFRPGKVPLPLLRKKYGPSVMGEVLEEAVNAGTRRAMEEKSLAPALQPAVQISSFSEGADLEFTVDIEVIPTFEPMDFKTISVERFKVQVPDEEVQNALDRLAESRGTTEPVEKPRKAKEGDIAVIDFVGKLDGVPFEGGSAEGYELELGSHSFIEGFEEQVEGMKPGEEKDINVTFPAEYGSEKLAGKPAIFSIKLNEIRQKKPAAIDEELAKSVGADSVEALKTQAREQIERNYAGLARMKMKRVLLDKLAEGHDFPVPPGLVAQEFDAIWKQIEEDKAKGALDETDKAKSDDELKAEYQGISERRVRLGLLLAEVGKRNNITVVQEDLNRALINEARRFPGQESHVFKYYREHPEALESLKAPIVEDKVIDFILEMATVTERPVTIEELMEDSQQGAAKAEAKPKKKAAKKKAGDEGAKEE